MNYSGAERNISEPEQVKQETLEKIIMDVFNEDDSENENETDNSAFNSSPNPRSSLCSNVPVRRHKQHTEDSLQAALLEIKNGQSIKETSMKHNIPSWTITYWMKWLNKFNNVPVRKYREATSSHNIKSVFFQGNQHKQDTEDSIQAALEDVRNGQPISRMSIKHNIPAKTLSKRMKQYNIK